MTAVDTHTGEIVEQMTPDEARRLTERIRLGCESIAERIDATVDLIEKARAGLADVALGYKSWTAYVEAEFASTLPRLDRSQRQNVVQRLAEKGMPSRAIAPVVGVTDRQVRTDITSGGKDFPPVAPSPAPRPVSPAPTTAPPRYEPSGLDEFAPESKQSAPTIPPPSPKIVGRDGKEYTRPAPRQPSRRPLTDTAREAGMALRRDAERIESICQDERFTQNREQVTTALRGHLLYVAEAVAAALDRLSDAKQEVTS